MIVLQVVEKLKKDYGLSFRDGGIDDKAKNFLERYATYAITNVKKVLMENLKRNAPTEKSNTGKRVKKKAITFNPTVHVKKEKIDDEQHETMNLEIVHATTADQETSTITMDLSKDSIKSFLMDVVTTHFRNGGGSLNNPNDFVQLLKNNNTGIGHGDIDDTERENDTGFGETNMPGLHEGLQVLLGEENVDNDMIVRGKEDDSYEEVYDGDDDCGQCRLVFNDCPTHNAMSLDKEFGPGMRCVGNTCRKTLIQCLNEGTMNTRGAYICKNCNKRECRRMMCNICYHDENSNERITRRGRSV